jgi:RimJ/RimL family protein N-acetyltransferase
VSEHAAPLFIVRGQSVALGPLSRDLVPRYHRWFNDLEVQRTTLHPRTIAIETLQADFETYVRSESNQPFAIYSLLDDPEGYQPVGIAGLKDIDFRNRTAELEIVIGESGARGKGLGTEATRLVADYGFIVLGLRNIMLTVYANNPAGIHAYQKAGFREFGRRTNAVEVAGHLFDVIYMEMVPENLEISILRDALGAGSTGEPPGGRSRSDDPLRQSI